MKDRNKSKKQLLEELGALRHKLSKLERTERQLRKSEERWRSFVKNVPERIMMLDRNGVILFTNRTAPGRKVNEVIGTSVYQYCPPQEQKKIQKILSSVFQSGKSCKYEAHIVRVDGTEVYYENSVGPIKHDGQIVSAILIANDISERKQAEEALRASESRLKSIINSMVDLVFTFDEKARFTFCSAPSHELYIQPEKFLGKKHSEVMPPDINKKFMKAFSSNRKGKPAEYEYALKIGGKTNWYSVRSNPITIDSRFRGIVAVVRNITNRKMAETELQSREQEIRMLADNVPGLVSYVGSDGCYRFINRKYKSWFGITRRDIIGKHYRDVLGDETYNLIEDHVQSVLSGQSVIYEKELPYIHGGKRWVSAEYVPDLDDSGNVKGFYALVVDITDRKRAEQEKGRLQHQLVQSEKMAGIGTLAGGIAHEFNNLLQIMRGHSEFALRTMKTEDMEEALNIVLDSSDKASKIIEDLRTFSKEESPKKESCEITRPIEEVLSLIEGQLRKNNIKVTKKFDKTPKLKINMGEMQQVFLNMINNAWDAMMPKGGKLEIKVKKVKGNVEITIGDTGKGIREEDLSKVFDPFFTTKKTKIGERKLRGTGLGLSVSYGIVKRHGGEIDVESKVGEGTTFIIRLPIK
jgi:PAS domain S-box-containing protein